MTTTDALDPSIARSGTATPVKAPDNTLGKDAFLKLLVAQMKYQDPMNPADGTEFVAQTAQFTMVEKLVEMEAQNEKLLQSQQSLTASTFIGRDVHWITEGSKGEDVHNYGTVTGVSFTKDGPTLRVGDKDIPLSVIQSVAPVITPPGEDTEGETPPAGEVDDTTSETPAEEPTDSTTTDGDTTGTDAATSTDPTD